MSATDELDDATTPLIVLWHGKHESAKKENANE